MNSSEANGPQGSTEAAARAVLELIAAARKGSLATLMAESGAPYASLVNVASDPKGQPILFLSRLAWHTRNVLADPRACLLITAERIGKDPLAAARVSLLGQLAMTDAGEAREFYFSHHPKARSYAQFGDFRLFKLNVETAHYVAGFGQIITIERPQLLRASY
jgi:putative heme iron utilization protein